MTSTTTYCSKLNAMVPTCTKVRVRGFTILQMRTGSVRKNRTEKRIDGAKSIGNGVPPTGEGK